MSMNYDEIKSYLKDAKQIEDSLSEYQELFDPEKLIEFKQVTKSLKRNLELVESKSRKLSIGIVGDVKAGKSSFLNACIFDGKEYLPKAATPMTAALTKITYSKEPKAIIHFYTKEDWETIEKQSSMYDEELKKEYDEHCKRMAALQAQSYGYTSAYVQPQSMQEFEKGYKCKSETQRGAKELTKMVVDPMLLNKLGGIDEIKGDIITQLNEYVGANGQYTPIVSYVELQVDNPSVENLEIVDTPGLNDPIVSRGICTKQFLRSCDVVLLLSPCSQFMNANTVTLMANSLPDAGVNEILVVGSKLDSGILNENIDDFLLAYKKSLKSYKTQFSKNLMQVKNMGRHMDILDKMNAEKVLFASAMCFSIDQKLGKRISLDDNEQVVYKNMHSQYKNFKDEYFRSLGGISKVKKALNEVLKRKTEIIEEKNGNLLENAKNGHLRILDRILQETVTSRSKLETVSAGELEKKSSMIRDTIDSSRGKLINIFDLASAKCNTKIQQILPQLTVEMGQHQRIAVEKKSHDESRSLRTGFLGLRKEIVHIHVTDNIADTSNVIENIKLYSAKCQSYVNGELQNIFSKEEFAQKIKNVVLDAFYKSQKDFDEDDILLPLNTVLEKISVSNILLEFTTYIDEIDTRFRDGYAKNDEIHQLTSLQSRLLDKIEKELTNQLAKTLENITDILNEQAVKFADVIQNEFCRELEKLQNQVKEKDQYIEKYCDFAEAVREMRKQIKE